MNEVNKTLYIPLYGKARVSEQNIILHDPKAEEIWKAETFPIKGRSGSKWLTYNMAMRARVFDDWTDAMLKENGDAMVLHVGCGLDGRVLRVSEPYRMWIDCDLPDVIEIRRKYYQETENYRMLALDASDTEQAGKLPDCEKVIVVMEGLSMYLTNDKLHDFFKIMQEKYAEIHVLMDVYTEFGAKASKIKNPINDVGVTEVYGIDDMEELIGDLNLYVKAEHSFTPDRLINELDRSEQKVFRLLYTGKMYSKIYRLYELETRPCNC